MTTPIIEALEEKLSREQKKVSERQEAKRELLRKFLETSGLVEPGRGYLLDPIIARYELTGDKGVLFEVCDRYVTDMSVEEYKKYLKEVDVKALKMAMRQLSVSGQYLGQLQASVQKAKRELDELQKSLQEARKKSEELGTIPVELPESLFEVHLKEKTDPVYVLADSAMDAIEAVFKKEQQSYKVTVESVKMIAENNVIVARKKVEPGTGQDA
jgi:hypothetical protein